MKRTVRYTEKVSFWYKHFKRHTCSKCGSRVQMRYIGRLLNLESPEARKYGFAEEAGMGELRTLYFYCPKCPRSISFEDMQEFEEGKR